jgi:hypothetical protein
MSSTQSRPSQVIHNRRTVSIDRVDVVEEEQSGTHGVVDEVGFRKDLNYDLLDARHGRVLLELHKGYIRSKAQTFGIISLTH